MMLQKIRALNFRLLEDFSLELSPDITVLIGPNNSGKSNIVDALLLLKQWTSETLSTVLGRRQGFDRVVSLHQTGKTVQLELTFLHPEHGVVTYNVSFSSEGLVEERTTIGNYGYKGVRDRGRNMIQWEYGGTRHDAGGDFTLIHPNPPELRPIRNFFNTAVHVDPFRQVALQAGIGAKHLVDPSGADLAQVLHYHYCGHRERFDLYEEIARHVLPEIETIESPILPGPQVTVSLRFVGESEKYNLWQLSSGLKDLLVLLAAVHFSPPNSLIIIEEPENHLHPGTQKALCTVIREAAARDRKQFILTTHSEVILGQFEPEKVVFICKEGLKANAIPLAKADLYGVWERLGIERTRLLQILGRARQIVAILEGREDYQALEPLWEHFDLRDKVLPVTSGGGGWKEIVDSAKILRESLGRFRLPSTVFVLLDGDGEREEKVAYLRAQGFGDDKSHVWSEKEVESYLLLPNALAALSQRGLGDVTRLIGEAPGRGKEHFERVLGKLDMVGTPKNLIVKHALAANPKEIPAELMQVPNKLRRLLGLPPA